MFFWEDTLEGDEPGALNALPAGAWGARGDSGSHACGAWEPPAGAPPEDRLGGAPWNAARCRQPGCVHARAEGCDTPPGHATARPSLGCSGQLRLTRLGCVGAIGEYPDWWMNQPRVLNSGRLAMVGFFGLREEYWG